VEPSVFFMPVPVLQFYKSVLKLLKSLLLSLQQNKPVFSNYWKSVLSFSILTSSASAACFLASAFLLLKYSQQILSSLHQLSLHIKAPFLQW
jgi:hypothetical protein